MSYKYLKDFTVAFNDKQEPWKAAAQLVRGMATEIEDEAKMNLQGDGKFPNYVAHIIEVLCDAATALENP